MTARELGAILETHGADELAGWLGRLQTLALVQSTGRPQGTRYFVDPALLLGADLKIPTTLLRIEPHQLLELIREDLQRYPLSKIGDISGRIGPEVNISQLKRALAELVSLGVVVMTGERSAARYRLAKKVMRCSLAQTAPNRTRLPHLLSQMTAAAWRSTPFCSLSPAAAALINEPNLNQ